ncbi:Potassium voltage-gated channel sub D member 1 [Branchiostoma belcheri]|nr:Potassium voltage-gated channel sub D member 1 [Branchiostoma belcheri]
MAEDIVGACCREAYMEKKEALEQIESSAANGEGGASTVTVRARLWSILDDPLSGTVAQAAFYVTGCMIVASIVANVVETIWCPKFGVLDEWLRCGDRYRITFSVVEITCVTYFTIEYSLRLFAAPNRREFVKSPLSVIDLVSIVPFYIALCIPENKELNGVFVTLRVFRVFRIFKLSRSSSGMQLLGQTLKACMRDLGFLLFALAMTVVIFATMMYYCERGRPESNFTSIPAGFWYIVVTMTTLGYGDMVPNTIVGMLVTAFCCLSSVVLLTLPVTVIVSNFNAIYRPEKVYRGDKALLTGGMENPERERFNRQHQHLIDCLRNTARPGFYLTRLQHKGSRDLHRSDASSSPPRPSKSSPWRPFSMITTKQVVEIDTFLYDDQPLQLCPAIKCNPTPQGVCYSPSYHGDRRLVQVTDGHFFGENVEEEETEQNLMLFFCEVDGVVVTCEGRRVVPDDEEWVPWGQLRQSLPADNNTTAP